MQGASVLGAPAPKLDEHQQAMGRASEIIPQRGRDTAGLQGPGIHVPPDLSLSISESAFFCL